MPADETEMLVSWTTISAIPDVASVRFGTNKISLTRVATAEVTHFVEGKTEFYTYRALLIGLTPKTVYCKANCINRNQTLILKYLPTFQIIKLAAMAVAYRLSFNLKRFRVVPIGTLDWRFMEIWATKMKSHYRFYRKMSRKIYMMSSFI